jgi:hypothetical protein
MDDLLPPAARKAFAGLTIETITEIENKKVAIECLHITPPTPGRKEDRRARGHILMGVHYLLETGLSKTEAYEAVAAQHFKSPNTIRRMYERALKGRRNRNRRN